MKMRRFHFNWRVTLFSIVCFCVFVNLGIWQLQRADEKKLLLEQRQAAGQLPPRRAGELATGDDEPGRRISFTGQFDESVTLLLDNRVLDGRVGFEVHQLFDDVSGMTFLVNRGFLPMGRTRQDLPEIPATGESPITVVGEIYEVDGAPVLLAEDDIVTNRFPVIVQQVEASAWSARLGTAIFPQVIRLAEGQPGALPRYWPATVIPVAKHQGYAAQWFTMAAAVLLVWLYFSFRREDEA